MGRRSTVRCRGIQQPVSFWGSRRFTPTYLEWRGWQSQTRMRLPRQAGNGEGVEDASEGNMLVFWRSTSSSKERTWCQWCWSQPCGTGLALMYIGPTPKGLRKDCKSCKNELSSVNIDSPSLLLAFLSLKATMFTSVPWRYWRAGNNIRCEACPLKRFHLTVELSLRMTSSSSVRCFPWLIPAISVILISWLQPFSSDQFSPDWLLFSLAPRGLVAGHPSQGRWKRESAKQISTREKQNSNKHQ